jgi:hypothetical protein
VPPALRRRLFFSGVHLQGPSTAVRDPNRRSHVIRRNTIFDCGQNGIVGHLGCIFSTIEDNHIHDIAVKREFYGYEIGGIKLHAALEVVIRHNRIHDCSLGTWLDWHTQGTRVTRNVYYANNRTCSSRSATDRISSNTTSSLPRRRWNCSARGARL